MKRTIAATISAVAYFTALGAHATLQPRIEVAGECQAYYDNVLDVTWAANADINGAMDHSAATAWVASLNIGGVTGWRLPNANPINGVVFNGFYSPAGTTDQGYNIHAPGTVSADPMASEMAHLFFNSLGNSAGINLANRKQGCFNSADSFCLTVPGPFANLQPATYWSATENPQHPPNSHYLTFMMDLGRQATLASEANQQTYAWPVHDGDVAVACDLGPPDDDGDGIPNTLDNCLTVTNGPVIPDIEGGASQQDSDGDTIGDACDFVVSTPWLGSARAGKVYNKQLEAVRGTPPYTWTLIDGNPPLGITLISSGLLAGEANSTFLTFFTVRVTDSTGDTATKDFRIRVTIPNCVDCHTSTDF